MNAYFYVSAQKENSAEYGAGIIKTVMCGLLPKVEKELVKECLVTLSEFKSPGEMIPIQRC